MLSCDIRKYLTFSELKGTKNFIKLNEILFYVWFKQWNREIVPENTMISSFYLKECFYTQAIQNILYYIIFCYKIL